jgi:hypothetical protein
MADIEVREVTRYTGETSTSGDQVREDTEYHVGANIDGTFVAFATINQGQIDVAKQREGLYETKKKNSKSKSDDSGTPDDSGK